MDDFRNKKETLYERLGSLGSVAVAFSGGIDSMCLLKAAADTLGKDNVIAVMVDSAFFERPERECAAGFCESWHIPLEILEMDVFAEGGLISNPPDRCYICKRAIFAAVGNVARKRGKACIAEGSNTDDLRDYRPGMRAIEELGVKSPFLDAGLSKQDVRRLAKCLDIREWDKPSSPCLATRFQFGETLTPDRLRAVSQAEEFLKGLGFCSVRARVCGDARRGVRIEVDSSQVERFADEDLMRAVAARLKDIGFLHVEVDEDGYRRGSMNR